MNKKTMYINALDTLFFRDGKPFSSGDETWGDMVFPPRPSVIYGALRTAYMFQNNLTLSQLLKDTEGFKIHNIYLLANGEPAFPMPFDLIKYDEDIHYLTKTSISNGFSSVETSHVLVAPKNEKADDLGSNGILRGNNLKRYLLNANLEVDTLSDYMTPEPKIGMGRDDSIRTTVGEATGMLYRVAMQRLEGKDENNLKIVIVYEGLENLEESGILRLGGEGKTAFYKVENDSFLLTPLSGLTSELKMYLTTPAIFENGWCPQWLLEGQIYNIKVNLQTCALGKSISIGGFDMEKQHPKSMYKAVPAGSVYHIETNNSQALYEELQSWESIHSKTTDNWSKQGFGKFFIGKGLNHG
jgi:CRISPR-associated protein Cmr3